MQPVAQALNVKPRVIRLAVAHLFLFQCLINPTAVGPHLFELLQIGPKPLVALNAVLKTFEIGFELKRWLCRNAVDHPGSVSRAFDEAFLTKIRKMLRNLCLLDSKDFLKMAYAKWPMREHVNDAQPGHVTEALVNLNQFHTRTWR
jgi:hypothetical protein